MDVDAVEQRTTDALAIILNLPAILLKRQDLQVRLSILTLRG